MRRTGEEEEGTVSKSLHPRSCRTQKDVTQSNETFQMKS